MAKKFNDKHCQSIYTNLGRSQPPGQNNPEQKNKPLGKKANNNVNPGILYKFFRHIKSRGIMNDLNFSKIIHGKSFITPARPCQAIKFFKYGVPSSNFFPKKGRPFYKFKIFNNLLPPI